MKITCFSRLSGCGVFRDFAWSSDLYEFGRFNLIYGWNGSGKTTLSRILRNLELRKAPTNGEVALSIAGQEIRGSKFPEASVPVRVFNRDFVTESVFRVDRGDVPPIHIVGRKSTEKQKQIEENQRDLAEAQASLEAERNNEHMAERAFDNHCVEYSGIIRGNLRSSGTNPYNNYDKRNYRQRAEKMAADGNVADYRLSAEEREQLSERHHSIPKPKIEEITYQMLDLKSLAYAVSDLLSATAASEAILSLRDDPELSAWVRQGFGLHRQRNSAECLFCEQMMPKERMAALEQHFNVKYELFIKILDDKINEVDAASKTTTKLTLPDLARFYDDLATEYDEAKSELRKALDDTMQFLDSLTRVLKEKEERAFEPFPMNVIVPEVDGGVVERLNGVIRKHNEACDDFIIRTEQVRERLHADHVASNLEGFKNLADKVQKNNEAIKEADEEVKHLKRKIEMLEREIVEHRQPAEELNDDLRHYLGHNEIQLEVKETGYTIVRNGVPATALSEGETTAIALLYFLKSLRDRRLDINKGVVVLDDPVSSLDANALYLAFGFIRERTQDAAQLFILTHNFTFFRNVKNWFHNLKGQRKKDISQRPARFYMLDWRFKSNQRFSVLCPLDPLLEQYESEYHYLFARIYREACRATGTTLEENYFLPNIARRLLEGFLAFRQPQLSGELWNQLKGVNFDEVKKMRILRFVHTHSHSNFIGEPGHDPSLLSEAPSVLKDILDLMKDQDAAHFDAMVKLAQTPAEGDYDE